MSLSPIISKVYHHPLTSHFTRYWAIPTLISTIAFIFLTTLIGLGALSRRTNLQQERALKVRRLYKLRICFWDFFV